MKRIKYDRNFLYVNFKQSTDSTVVWNNPSGAGAPWKTEGGGSCLYLTPEMIEKGMLQKLDQILVRRKAIQFIYHIFA